jgi:hypothetical protein
MKTIFVVVQSGFMARFILRSGILENLKKFSRITILSPNSHEQYFIDEFNDEKVHIEPLRTELYENYEKNHPVERFIRQIRWYILPLSSTVKLRRKSFLRNMVRSKSIKNILKAAVIWFLSLILDNSMWARRQFLKIECRLFSPRFHRDIFDKYKPSAIITSSLGYLGYDHFIMREAKMTKTKTIATLLSWDNTSSKGLKGAFADSIIVWTDNMKEELIRHYDEDGEKILVGGIPHFDIYFQQTNLSKERFLKKYSLSPGKKIILYATRSPNKYPWNPVIIENFIKAIKDNRFIVPVQLLVRVHPLHYELHDNLRYKAIRDKYKEIENQNGELVRFAYPEILSSCLKCDMPYSDIEALKEMLRFSDVMICNFSTMMIEASIFNLPFVNIAIYGHNKEIGSDTRNFSDQFVHLRRLKDAGEVAYSFEELVETVNDYLQNPEKHADQRQAVVEHECGPHKGNSARLVADIIGDVLKLEPQLSESISN